MSIRQNFPTTPPSLVLDFANSKTLDPRITFSRTTTATRMNELGLIETVSADIPRFDHKYENGVIKSLGLLIEESRVNLALDGTTFANPNWLKGGTLINTLFEVSPDGTQNAAKLYPDDSDTNSQHSIVRTISGLSDNTIYTSSIFIKKFGSQFSWCRLTLRSKDGDFTGIYFNYDTKTFGIAIGGSKLISYDYEEYPNGWIRLYIVTNTSTGAITPTFHLWIANGNGVLNYNYTGGDADGFYIWGAQLEQGAFPTSYIPTQSSTATRNPDTTQITGINLNSWFNPNEGTFIINHKWNTLDTFVDSLFAVSTNGSSGINLYDVTSSAYGAGLQYPSTNNFQEITEVGSYKYGLTYDSSSRATLKDGGTVIEDANAFTSLNTVNRFSIGMDRLNNWHGSKTISKLTYYPTRLSNDNLQNLTK